MVITTIRLPEELHQRIRELATRRGLTVNAEIISLLWQAVETERKPKT